MRITHANIKNFTVFESASLELGGLNIIHGENGAGKSHLLKLLYSVLASLKPGRSQGAPDHPTKEWFEREVARKLTSVLRPDALGRLATRRPHRVRADVSLSFDEPQLDLAFASSSSASSLSTKRPISPALPYATLVSPSALTASP